MNQMKLPKSHIYVAMLFCICLIFQGMALADQSYFTAIQAEASNVNETKLVLETNYSDKFAQAVSDTWEETEKISSFIEETAIKEGKKTKYQEWQQIRTEKEEERERLAKEAAERAAAEAAAREAAARAAEEAARVAAAQAAAQAQAQAQAQAGSFALAWPVPASHVITSGFGPRPNLPIAGVSPYHNGIDIGAPQGTPIVAAADGVVWYVGDGAAVGSNSGGLQVWIHHEGGRYTTTYMHASQILVGAGQAVKAGDVIALVGSTGASTGPHLDFRIMCGGGYVNPQGAQVTYIQ